MEMEREKEERRKGGRRKERGKEEKRKEGRERRKEKI